MVEGNSAAFAADPIAQLAVQQLIAQTFGLTVLMNQALAAAGGVALLCTLQLDIVDAAAAECHGHHKRLSNIAERG